LVQLFAGYQYKACSVISPYLRLNAAAGFLPLLRIG
jgi:hypothetical protein